MKLTDNMVGTIVDEVRKRINVAGCIDAYDQEATISIDLSCLAEIISAKLPTAIIEIDHIYDEYSREIRFNISRK